MQSKKVNIQAIYDLIYAKTINENTLNNLLPQLRAVDDCVLTDGVAGFCVKYTNILGGKFDKPLTFSRLILREVMVILIKKVRSVRHDPENREYDRFEIEPGNLTKLGKLEYDPTNALHSGMQEMYNNGNRYAETLKELAIAIREELILYKQD